ncbi:MAG: hypothetical protein RQ801_12060, partial [Spirochaetaceae bacterium]|nr:hypothetical protein [Spirochaetaceae bacterium]
ERGRRFEEEFYYRRAYDEYRRALLIAKTDPDVWIAFADLIRKMGFPEYYRDRLNFAHTKIPSERAESATLKRRLDLLEHSQEETLAQRWGIDEPWIVPAASWTLGVFFTDESSSLPIHGGADDTLSLYFADIVDSGGNLEVPSVSGINDLMVRRVSGFSEAFRYSREQSLHYFLMMGFVETERTFHATSELFLARTGESLGRLDQLRTGQGRVADALHGLSDDLQTLIPRKMKILDVQGSKVLLDKGRWDGINGELPWIVLRGGAGRPSAVEGGLSYAPSDYLGSVEIDEISEPLSEGTYVRSGDFEFIRPGDEVFLLPVPEHLSQVFEAPDPAFRASMLAIP